jgi:hypothetical protein
MKITPKKLFLIDAIGALVSAIFLGVVLVNLQAYIGMPHDVLYLLAFLPVLFFIYSISCYSFIKNNWKPYLRIIAVVNILYCILSISMIIIHASSLTILGYVYFIVEVIIVGVLAVVEYRTAIST